MEKQAVIVAYGRSPMGRAFKGSFANMHPVEYASQVLKGVLDKLPALDPAQIDDVLVGCAVPEGQCGWNVSRLIAQRAGLPDCVPAQTINRFCSSGLQTIATAANAILAGAMDVVVAGGVERMTGMTMGLQPEFEYARLAAQIPASYMQMGITAENVAERYNISRADMEVMAAESHRKAAAAQAAGKFVDEIIPVTVETEADCFLLSHDEGIRPDTTPEGLSKLKPAFKEDGVVTAATSSQMTDGAAFVVLMSADKARELGITPIARFRGFAVGGVAPEVMGIGPVVAIPKVMEKTGLSISDMDVIELNEAFAAQALACIRVLGLPPEKVNPNGGAMALGHPMGATGSVLTCKALSHLARTGGKYALISMCIGGGMGAAGIFERLG